MNTLLRTSTLLLGLLASTPFATKRVVSETPLGLEYGTIAAAVSGASAGDTVIINSYSLGRWNENITIDKKLLITKAASSTTAQVRGTWTVNTGDTVVFEDVDLDGTLTYTSTSATGLLLVSNSIISGAVATAGTPVAGSVVRVIGSNLKSAVNVGVAYTAELFSNSILGATTIYRGDVIGNSLGSSASLTIVDGATMTDTVQVIGNYLGCYTYWNSSSVSGVVSNNKIPNGTKLSNAHILVNTLGSGKFLRISHNQIVISESSNYYDGVLLYSSSVLGNILLDHNYFIGYYNGSYYYGYGWERVGSSGYLSTLHNLHTRTNALGNSNNDIGNIIDNNTTATLTDLGSVDPLYNDVDGTRADIGLEGGATPYSQYDRSGWIPAADRKPRVYEIKAPLKVLNGQSFSIKAKAFDR